MPRIFRIALFLTVLAVFVPVSAGAQSGLVPCTITQCHICDLAELLKRVTDFFILRVALPGSALLFALGGIMLLISGTSEQRRTQGKTIIWRTVIGIVIILLSWTFIDTLIKVLTGTTAASGSDTFYPGKLGPWNEFNLEKCKEGFAP
ncbi:hypothetical protein C4552_01610 [Candidatus Parcubacteria bacterium]|nr:MAG: hypothetical protein C4552_01610 [Candidatus Parcubacteria bacterium]